MRKRIAAAAIALFGLLAGEAAACGYCVEDKIASTYDHAVVTRALAQGHHVVFFHIDGHASPAEPTRRLLQDAVHSVAAIDKGTARLSPDLLTLSVAFDPRRVSLAELISRLDRRLSARKLSLMPLRVMEEPADLKAVRR